MKLNHRLNWRKNVPETGAKFVKIPCESTGIAHGLIKLLAGQQAGFILKEQGRSGNQASHFDKRHSAARGDFRYGDGIIEINQHLAQIENDCSDHGLRRLKLELPSALQRAAQRDLVSKLQP